MNAKPEHAEQSGWQVVHTPEELKEFDGHEETHLPLEASWLLEHVKQKVDVPAQLLHDESHAVGVVEIAIY